MLHCELLVNGHFLGGPCDQGIGKDQVYAIYDGKLIGTVAEGYWAEMDAALDAATTAFEEWRISPFTERADLLDRIAASVRDRAEELAQLLVQEIGKPITFARAEVERLALTFDLAAEEANQMTISTPVDVSYDKRGQAFTAEKRRIPLGPIFCIVPYNWPFNLAAHKIAPALASGNTIILKAPVIGMLATLTLARIIHECGCPPGVINALHCPNEVAEKALLDDRIKMLSFTGSEKVGWMLKEKLPNKPVTLELGGDAFAIVCEDADLDQAVKKIIPAAYGYAGQICISIQHILCQASVYEQFKEKLITAVNECQYGDPSLESTVCGPLIDDKHADKMLELYTEAEQQGATILAGGSRLARVITPTLIENVPFQTQLGKDEAFGPVATLASFDHPKDALTRLNQSRFGIHCGLFTNDPLTQELFAMEAQVAGVVINDAPSIRFDALPYGGEKRSGFGREGVQSAIASMTKEKSIVKRITP